jgi:hypothetical protein
MPLASIALICEEVSGPKNVTTTVVVDANDGRWSEDGVTIVAIISHVLLRITKNVINRIWTATTKHFGFKVALSVFLSLEGTIISRSGRTARWSPAEYSAANLNRAYFMKFLSWFPISSRLWEYSSQVLWLHSRNPYRSFYTRTSILRRENCVS